MKLVLIWSGHTKTAPESFSISLECHHGTEESGNKIGRITTGGAITEYPVPTAGSEPIGIASGPDRRVWFTGYQGNNIGALRPSAASPRT